MSVINIHEQSTAFMVDTPHPGKNSKLANVSGWDNFHVVEKKEN